MATTPLTHSFAGFWLTTFGDLSLEQRGTKISGTYHYAATQGRLDGTISGDTLRFRYQEPNEQGEGVFQLLRAGKFVGTYTAAGDSATASARTSAPSVWPGRYSRPSRGSR